jgi:hypothetical protein
MNGAFRDLLAWLMPWRANFTPEPVDGPYGAAAGAVCRAGARAADTFIAGTTAGQTYEH